MDIDPFLYVALGGGVLLGWALRPRTPWIARATQATVLALLFFLGASLIRVPASDLPSAIALGLGFAVLILACSVAIALLIPRARAPPPVAPPTEGLPTSSSWFSVALIAALVVGYATASAVPVPAENGITYALYLLLFLVGLGLQWLWRSLARVWVPVTAALLGAVAAAGIYTAATGLALRSSLAITFAFGWYSLDGPLVAARLGAALGLLAFLANFLRENLTMLLAPVIGRRLRGEGLTAMGGATSMDTTLYFVARFGDAEAASLALTSGLILTVLASLLVPLLLALPAGMRYVP